MSNTNVVNPGLVNVADQAQSPVALTQTIAVGPSTVGSSTSQGAAGAPGLGIANAASQVTPPMTAGLNVNADAESSVELPIVSTTQNNVVGQRFGSATPANVYV